METKPNRLIRSTSKFFLVKNSKFALMLNPKTFSFQLRNVENSADNPFFIKILSTKEMKMFGSSVKMISDPPHDSTLFMCPICDRFIEGFCFRHPIVFVKEEIPKAMPYTCYETIPSFLELRDSTIAAAGRGMFTKICLPAGLAFGPYTGHLYLDPNKGGYKYTYELYYSRGRKYWVNAERLSYSNWLRWVNCARYEQEQNIIGLEYMQNIFFCVYKPVEADSELFVWYGANYGATLNIPGAERCLSVKAPLKKTMIKCKK